MSKKILLSIISGKRPDEKRLTEKWLLSSGLSDKYKTILFSNNSEGYNILEGQSLIDIPQDFRDYFEKEHKLDMFGMMAPMSRSYSDKWAIENGYDVNIQLDDNIGSLGLVNCFSKERINASSKDPETYAIIFEEFITKACELIDTGVSKVGCELPLPPVRKPQVNFGTYPYSMFATNLHMPVPEFVGSTEDDITDSIRRSQMNMLTAKITYITYAKPSAVAGKDNTGSRAAYAALDGQKHSRGWVQEKYYPGLYSRGYSSAPTGSSHKDYEVFKHKLKPLPTVEPVRYIKDSLELDELIEKVRSIRTKIFKRELKFEDFIL